VKRETYSLSDLIFINNSSFWLYATAIQLPIHVLQLPADPAYYSVVLPKQQQAGYINGVLRNVVNNE